MKIDNICLVGAGTLGTQIAMVAAASGYRVKTYDPVKNALSKNLVDLRSTLTAKDAHPMIPFNKWDELCEGIGQFTILSDACQDADLVIEAVNEDLVMKREVFARLGEVTPGNAILATNSSSLLVSRIEESSGRPVGLRVA